MKKNDLKLIGAFIDSKNPKAASNYALVKPSGIYATDTRKAIRFCFYGLDNVGLIHKKLLKGFESILGKDEVVSYKDGYFYVQEAKLPIDTSYHFVENEKRYGVHPTDYVDIDKIINQDLPNHFVLEDISDIQFELAQKNCFIDDVHLNPIISFTDCSYFDIFYKPQAKDEQEKMIDTGIVKIVGSRHDSDGVMNVCFIAVIMGRTFESKASE
jgi:hypothetical protein